LQGFERALQHRQATQFEKSGVGEGEGTGRLGGNRDARLRLVAERSLRGIEGNALPGRWSPKSGCDILRDVFQAK
jgi:hypothetical protein